MRLLITGGFGFMGSNLAADAISRGDRVVIFDNLYRNASSANRDWLNEVGDYQFVHGDIRNQSDITRCIAELEPDVIFHLGGQVAMTTSISNPQNDFEVNALGSLYVLEAIRKYTPETKLIYSSTNKVYGDLESYNYVETQTRYRCTDFPEGFSEEIPLNFRTPYGCSKGAADQYILDYSHMFSINSTVFRHSSMYGGRQFATVDQGWVGWFCKNALLTKYDCTHTFSISGNGKQVRDVLHVDDVVHLYRVAIEKFDNVKGNAFNIGGGFDNSLSLLELFHYLEELLDVELVYNNLRPRLSDQRVFVANINKVSKTLGWSPIVDKFDGIQRTVNWLENEKVKYKK